MQLKDESFYRMTLTAAYTTYFLIRNHFVLEPLPLNREDELKHFHQSVENEGKYSLMLRTVLAPTLLLMPAVYILYPTWVSYFNIPMSPPLRLTATTITLISLPFLYWIHSHLGKFWSSDLELHEDHHLVKTGLYQWIRHPMYTALLLFYAGTSLTSANWIVLVPNFASILIMLTRIRKEEEMLIKKFGQEYLDYREQTGTLLPKLIPF